VKNGVTFTDWEADEADIKRAITPYSDIWAVWSDRGAILAWQGKVIRTQVDPLKLGTILGPKRLKWSGWDLKEIFKHLNLTGEIPAWDGRLAAICRACGQNGDFRRIVFEILRGNSAAARDA